MSLGSGEWSIVILIGQEKRTSHPKEDFLQNEKLETHTLRINKSYQRLHREDVITPPKTLKSNRTIKMPQFLCDEMQDYLKMLYEPKEDERIFTISKSYLHHEMNRGSRDGKVIGLSSSAVYSSHYHKMISECTIDMEYAKECEEVIVKWGDYGKRIKDIRAVIAKFPLNDLVENKNYDISSCPYGFEE